MKGPFNKFSTAVNLLLGSSEISMCVFLCVCVTEREWIRFLNINLPLKYKQSSQKYNNHGHFKRRLLVLHCLL